MLKRLVPILLCFVLLVACNGNTAELMDFIEAYESEADYFGEKVQAFNSEGKVWAYSDNNSPQSDALWKRIAFVEDKLNVDIEMTYKGDDGFVKYMTTTIAAGSCETDLVYKSSGNDLWFLGEAECLHPITDFPERIDLSQTEKYGTPGVLEAAMFNGVPYAVQPVLWPGLQGIECFFIAYNPEDTAANGLTDLHEYYENRTWTWDTFKKYLDVAEGTVSGDDIIFEAHGGYLLNTLFMSNGFDYITFVDGIPTFDLTPEEALRAVEYLRDLSLFGDKINIAAERWEYDAFAEGKSYTSLVTANAVTTGSIAYGDVPYGIMPFPSGPDVEYGKWAQSVTRIYGLAIPISAADPECVAHVINELCEPMEEFGGSKEGLIQYYRDNVFTTDLDVEIYFSVENNVRYDYDDAKLINEYTGLIAENISKSSPSELIEKYSKIVEQIFRNYIEPNLTGYIIEHMNIE